MSPSETFRQPSPFPLLADIDLSKPISMRLLLVDYPRLPQLTPSMFPRFVELVEARAREYLQAEIRMELVGKTPLQALFRHHLPRGAHRILRRWIIPHQEIEARDMIVWALERSHRGTQMGPSRQIIRGHPLFPQAPGSLPQRTIFLRAADYQISVLRAIYGQTLPDGSPLVADPLFAQARAWEMLAAEQDRADILLTSHPIASAESGQTLAVALRGGFNAGLVARNPGPLQGVIVFSTYPFIERESLLPKRRTASPLDPVQVMALYLVHELGHLLRRWGHDWGHPPGCLMRPALSLDYETWFHRVRTHGPCDLPHPRMKAF